MEYTVYVLTAPGLSSDMFFGAYGEKSEANDAAIQKFESNDRWSILEIDPDDLAKIIAVASGEEAER